MKKGEMMGKVKVMGELGWVKCGERGVGVGEMKGGEGEREVEGMEKV